MAYAAANVPGGHMPHALQASALHMPQELCSSAGQESEAAYTLAPTGLDQVQFMLGAGPGEPLRPLAEVASGGESARIMLALKAAPAVIMNEDEHTLDYLTGTLLTPDRTPLHVCAIIIVSCNNATLTGKVVLL